MANLPIIDISAFFTDDEQLKRETALKLRKVCSEIGFFYLTGHGIPQDMVDEAHKQAREFFKLPLEVKNEISVQNSPHFRGYQALGENITRKKRDWHEAIDLYKEYPEDGTPLLGPNQWPRLPTTFKPFFEEYSQKMTNLGFTVMRAIAMSLDLDEHYFDKFCNDSFTYYRVINYPPLNDHVTRTEENVGESCGVHCDYGCLTFVNQDDTQGALWVQSNDGEWIAANPVPGAFTVNLGDMLKLWTGNLYQSTPHKVVHANKDTYRTSIPFFFEPNFDAIISPLPLPEYLFEKKKQQDFEPVKYSDHLISKVLGNFVFGDKPMKREKY